MLHQTKTSVTQQNIHLSTKLKNFKSKKIIFTYFCFHLVLFRNWLSLSWFNIMTFQAKWGGHAHQDPEFWRFLRFVWRRKICHSLRISPVLHGKAGSVEREKWRNHRAEISSELCWSNNWKVRTVGFFFICKISLVNL